MSLKETVVNYITFLW